MMSLRVHGDRLCGHFLQQLRTQKNLDGKLNWNRPIFSERYWLFRCENREQM